MNKNCYNCLHAPENNGVGYWPHDPCMRCICADEWEAIPDKTDEQTTDSKEGGMAFTPKPGQWVILGDTEETMGPGRFIGLDHDTEYQFVGRKEKSPYAQGFRYCEPILPDFPMDHPLWVWNSDPRNAKPRCFAGEFNKSGCIVCWDKGRVQHTAGNAKVAWEYWSETDPNAKP